MVLSSQTSRILRRLHDEIYSCRHQNGFDGFRTQLHDSCVDTTQRVATEGEFGAAIVSTCQLSSEDASALFRGLTASVGGSDGQQIPFAHILRALRPPACRQRVALTRAVFDMIDRDRDGLLSRDQILACYRAGNHPDVRRGLKASAQIRQDVLQTLADFATTSSDSCGSHVVAFPAFLDFYSSLTAFTSDEHFRDTIVAVWAPPTATDNERSFALHTLGAGGGLVANLRSQILSKGLRGVSDFRRGVRTATEKGKGGDDITQADFYAAVRLAGADLTASEMNQAFRHLDRRAAGAILASDALRAVRGEVDTVRARAIDEAFDYLLYDTDGSKSRGDSDGETLDPSAVAQFFRAEAHPCISTGSREPREVLAEFLEAFEGGGEVNGRITRAEWREHHSDVSALFPNSDDFCAYLDAIWKTSKKADIAGSSRNDANDNSAAHEEDCGGKIYEVGIDGADTATGNNDECQGDRKHAEPDTGHKPQPTESLASDAVSPKSPTRCRVPCEAWGARSRHTIHSHDGMGLPAGGIGYLSRAGSGTGTMETPPGVKCLLDRARVGLARSGVSGAFGLLKALREEDGDGTARVALAGFKKAVGDAELGMTEVEMRIIFEHLDTAGEGTVPYEAFLRSIREPLSSRRLALAHEAFDFVDADGDGFVFVEDMANAFQASQHPAVLDGTREEGHVQQEFFNSFAVADGAGKYCTRNDFLTWIELLSSSLPTPGADNRFDEIVRGCWGLPTKPAEGAVTIKQNSNSYGAKPGDIETIPWVGEDALCVRKPVRVVITHADGSVSVSGDVFILCNKAGLDSISVSGDQQSSGYNTLSEAQADDIRQQLAARGIHAVHVQLLATGDRAENGPIPQGNIDGDGVSSEELRIARLGPAVNGVMSGEGEEGGSGWFGLDYGLLSVLKASRKRLALRGPAGFFSLSRRLRRASVVRQFSHASLPGTIARSDHHDGSNSYETIPRIGLFLSLGRLKEVLSEVGCGLSGKDVTRVFLHLDTSGRGEIALESALDAVRGRLPTARLALVRTVFARLASTGAAKRTSEADAFKVAEAFHSRDHPEVITGRRTAEDVRQEFMDAVITTGGVITRNDFEAFYADVSAAITCDKYFSLLLQKSWGLGPATATASSTTWKPPTTGDPAGQSATRLSGDYDRSLVRRVYSKARTSAPAGVLPGTVTGTSRRVRGEVGSSGARPPTAGVIAVLRKLAGEVKGQGAAWGLAGLKRALQEADRDNDGLLSLREFKLALASSGAGITPAEIRALFTHLETGGGDVTQGGGMRGGDGSGTAPWRVFLEEVRPGLSGKRLGLVRLAFGKMDPRGEGSVSPETVKQRFDASRHPSVLKGNATVEEVWKELLDTFFARGDEDSGRVTEADFIDHHASLSFGVQDDRHFRQIVTNCWGLNGPYRSDSNASGSNTHSYRNIAGRSVMLGNTTTTEKDHDAGAPADATHAHESSVDRRNAWSFGPMSLSEIRKTEHATATQNIPGRIDGIQTAENNDDNNNNDGNCSSGSARMIDLEQSRSEFGSMRDAENAETSSEADVTSTDRDHGVERETARSESTAKGDDGGGAGGKARRRLRRGGRDAGRQLGPREREADLSVRYLMEKVRSELSSRGVAGSVALSRRLRETTQEDNGKYDHDGRVSEVDFRRALRDTYAPLTESDIRRLFSHFEMGRSGVMNPESFMSWLGGHMNGRRRAVVDEAYQRLGDYSESKQLELDQVLDAFDATRHPDVVNGRMAPDEVFRDFVDGFTAAFSEENGAECMVSRDDFLRYYDTVSATVPDDAYFDLLVRRSWRVPATKGWVSADDTQRNGNSGVQSLPLSADGWRTPSKVNNNSNDNGSINNSNNTQQGPCPSPSLEQGRELCYDGLRKARASSGPSEENRRLRSAVLSRTFDSQISFGDRNSAQECYRTKTMPTAVNGVDVVPPPAGGGRTMRMAEGAAWTPGGRRHVPGSKVFMSHLGNGLRVNKDESGRLIDSNQNRSYTRAINDSHSARKSHAALMARKTPTWLPEELSDHFPRAGNMASSKQIGIGANIGRSLFDSVSLAQLAKSTGFDGRILREGGGRGGQNENATGDGVDQPLESVGSYFSSSPRHAGDHHAHLRNCEGCTRTARDHEEQASICSSTRQGRGYLAKFDWWGGASASRHGGGGVTDGGDCGEEGAVPRTKHISDTYKSSLVFG